VTQNLGQYLPEEVKLGFNIIIFIIGTEHSS